MFYRDNTVNRQTIIHSSIHVKQYLISIYSLSANWNVLQVLSMSSVNWETPLLSVINSNFCTNIYIFTRNCSHTLYSFYCTFAFRRSDVNGFGIWGCSTIQIFVKKATDYEKLKSELVSLNQSFFEKYHLKIETRNMVEKQTLRHYNSTMLKYIL